MSHINGRRSWFYIACIIAPALGVCWSVTPAAGENKGDTAKAALPADLALISPKALGFLSVRPAYLWDHAAFKEARLLLPKAFPDAAPDFEALIGAAPAEIERLTFVAPGIIAQGNGQPHVYVVTVKPYVAKKVLATLVPSAKVEKRKGQSLHVGGRKAVYLINDRSYVVGETGDMQSMLDRGPAKKPGPLTGALHLAARTHAAVIGGNPEQLRPLTERLPAEVEPFVPLLQAQSVVVTVDVDKKIQGVLRFSFTAVGNAREGAKALKALVELARGSIDQGIAQVSKNKEFVSWVDVLKDAKAAVRGVVMETQGNDVQVAASLKTDLTPADAFLADAVLKNRSAAGRAQSSNNLKQIALAMHAFHDNFGSFPAAANFDQDGKPLLSWRVLVLPYLDQGALYKEFHVDEPWDSEHNKKLLARMPKVYAVPEAKVPAGHTIYQGFDGKGAFFDGKKGQPITDFKDGVSNTIMIVEAPHSVPWTKPADLPFDPKKPLPKVGFRLEGFLGAMCDGSVHFLPSKRLTQTTLRSLITRNGDDRIGPDFE